MKLRENQNLSFDSLRDALSSRKIEFGKAQMKTLKLIGEDGLFTNLALILSDQCPITTKVAVFQGTEKVVFRDRQEFGGSIIKQMEEVYHFIDLCNKTKAVFSGLNRIDMRDYPEEAVREAWLNSVVHRDYSFSVSNIVNIYDDRIEFVSIGGLVPGLELNSIFLGISQPRNPNLAALFYRMKLIESYGTGIGKIERAYKETGRLPVFETAAGVFRVTLPNCNEDSGSQDQSPNQGTKTESYDSQKEALVKHASSNGQITRQKAEEILVSGSTKAYRLLKELCSEGRLKAQGNGKLVRYIPI